MYLSFKPLASNCHTERTLLLLLYLALYNYFWSNWFLRKEQERKPHSANYSRARSFAISRLLTSVMTSTKQAVLVYVLLEDPTFSVWGIIFKKCSVHLILAVLLPKRDIKATDYAKEWSFSWGKWVSWASTYVVLKVPTTILYFGILLSFIKGLLPVNLFSLVQP